MKKYQELIEKIIFNFNDALELFNNKATKYASLSRLEKQSLIKNVQNNLYVSMNPVNQTSFASKYQIGSTINDNAYIIHTSALEYYCYQSQVSYICYVSSTKRFSSFEFKGITYK